MHNGGDRVSEAEQVAEPVDAVHELLVGPYGKCQEVDRGEIGVAWFSPALVQRQANHVALEALRLPKRMRILILNADQVLDRSGATSA